MSHTQPVIVKIARQNLVDGNLSLTIVKNEELKKNLLKLYKEYFANSGQQDEEGRNATGMHETMAHRIFPRRPL